MPQPRQTSRYTPKYEFDPRLGSTGRYVEVRSGRIVSADIINQAMEQQIDQARRNIRSVTLDLAQGNISIPEWQTAMRDQMRVIHAQTGALAKGGWAQMSQSDWGAIGRISRDQYQYLEKFAIQVETGQVNLTNLAGEPSGYLLRRADLYGQAGITTHNEMQKRKATHGGATHKMRELDPTVKKHCDCCLTWAGPVVPIDDQTMPAIGNCTCSKNCRCRMRFGRLVDGTFTEG